MRQLSTFTGAQFVKREGNVDIYLGSGQPLVIGNTVNKLEAVPSKDDPGRLSLQVNRGSSTIDINQIIDRW